MKVKELIEKLKQFPQDKEIVMDDSSLIFTIPNYIYEYKPVISFEPYTEREETIVVISSE